jgi:hypothetical protein
VKQYLCDFKTKMLPDYYLEDINSSLKIACTESCDNKTSLNYYKNLVEQYQQQKKQLEETESLLLKSEASMFITMAQMEKNRRLKDLAEDDKRFYGNTEENDEDKEDDEEDNDSNN